MDSFAFMGKARFSPKGFVEGLLAEGVRRVNKGVSTTLTARRTSERPPRDSRHLTDTRTRVSTLLEYSLAYEMNHALQEDGKGYSVSAVLWNVFPDLVVRNAARENLFGLEVKALHTAAEEKSANFMTPIQIVRRDRDFIVILSWGWQTSTNTGVSIIYPHIHAAAVFDAWLLAKIRDYGWLLKQGGRVKGIDLATPIIDGEAELFKAEEGNLGKLMRIQLPSEMPATVPHYAEMKEEDSIYTRFKELVLALGLRETFLDLCILEGATDVSVCDPAGYPSECQVLGTAKRTGAKTLALIAGPRPDAWLQKNGQKHLAQGTACFWLSKKLDWKVYAVQKGQWTAVKQGAKPDSDYNSIQQALGST